MNLVTVDSQSIFGYVMMAQNMITAPIMVVVSVAFIIYELGIIGIATPFFFIIGAYLQKLVNSKAFKLRRIILQWTDKRSKQLNEFFENIRVIKFYGWEEMISKRILDIRATETSNLLKNQIIKTAVEVIMNSTPIVISLFIFGLYAGLYGDLESATAYTVISLLNLLLNPLKMIVIVLLLQQNATTSISRINEFFMAEEKEIDINDRIDTQNLEIGQILVQDASFAWDSLKSAIHNNMSKFNRRNDSTNKNNQIVQTDSKQMSNFPSTVKPIVNGRNKIIPFSDQTKDIQLSGIEQLCLRDLRVLKNINLNIQAGDTVAIVGQVASGKSSLLLAILGEMINTQGNIKMNGTIAYVPQSAWLQNASLRDNIIFGLPYEKEKYDRIIEKCQLKADLANKEVFPNGDLTEIGERGSNLSGGQRQRIGIARAVYADADIYLIDDCLSALDAQVGKLIYYEILMEELEDKTIIFVTHALHFIEDVKKIVVLKEGEIVNQGDHQYLHKNCQEYQKLTLVDNTNGVANNSDEEDEDDGDNESDFDDSELSISESCSDSDDSDESDQAQSKNRIVSNPSSLDCQQERVKLQRKERRQRNEVQEASENIPDFNFTEQRNFGLQFQEERKSIISSRRRSRQLSRQTSKSSLNPMNKKSRFSSFRKKETINRPSLDLSHLDEKNKFEESGVPYTVYKRYITSGGLWATFNMLISFLLAQAFKVLSDWWIGQWSSNEYNQKNSFYIIIFFIFGALQAIFIYVRGYTFGLFTINSSSQFQRQLVLKLLHTPQWWYDITPIGKIISRTTKDQDDMDSTLPWNMKFALTNIIQLITVVLTIGIIFPHFIILGVVCFYGYSIIIKFYLITAREIKKIEASTRAPVISHFQETTNGILVIRAFQRQSMFMKKMLQKWVSVVTDLMGLLIVTCCAYFSVLSRSFNIISNVSLIGLALSSSFQISQIISFTLKLLADTESNMNSLVRILSLIDSNPQESSWDDKKAPQNWPSNGEIVFKNVSLKYRPELPQIVNNLSIKFEKNQKIGVVGRTGCGKSTLTLGILRILEITFDQTNEMGNIILDDQDISEIGLHELRQKVTIIPQDPILFSGTLRSNLDPFNQYSDSLLIEMLKKVNIWEQLDKILEKQQDNNNNRRKENTYLKSKSNRVTNMNVSDLGEEHKLKLNLLVESGGSNFSLGQRQLICIARALIKKPKVLLMDEATASIDEMTDVVIQNLIKQELKNATVITIAHRLKTIMQYDKILVLDKGNMKEFDTPHNLLNREQSFFRNLVIENGLIFLEEMKLLALKKEQENKSSSSQNEQPITQHTEGNLDYTFCVDNSKSNNFIGKRHIIPPASRVISQQSTEKQNNTSIMKITNENMDISNNQIVQDIYLSKQHIHNSLQTENNVSQSNILLTHHTKEQNP